MLRFCFIWISGCLLVTDGWRACSARDGNDDILVAFSTADPEACDTKFAWNGVTRMTQCLGAL
jgi:hypothetical protein